jgi:hypothetical protein
LYDGAGKRLDSTTTDDSGSYAFINLMPGDYSVKFTAPGDYLFSPSDTGADDAADSDADPVTGQAIVTTLDSGEHDPTWDARAVSHHTRHRTRQNGQWHHGKL